MYELIRARAILLVEDCLADVTMVEEALSESNFDFRIDAVTRLADALVHIRENEYDAVLLDLNLPDSQGLDTVQRVRQSGVTAPLIVMTGAEDDEEFGFACIRAGAEDFLRKSELRGSSLRRAIGFSISRYCERRAESHYAGLSSDGASTSVTGGMTGQGPVRDRYPGDFDAVVRRYREALVGYLEAIGHRGGTKPRGEMRAIITALGALGGGPRDLIDLHLAALQSQSELQTESRVRASATEGRLLAIEMMGLLVEHYRTGVRAPRTSSSDDDSDTERPARVEGRV